MSTIWSFLVSLVGAWWLFLDQYDKATCYFVAAILIHLLNKD